MDTRNHRCVHRPTYFLPPHDLLRLVVNGLIKWPQSCILAHCRQSVCSRLSLSVNSIQNDPMTAALNHLPPCIYWHYSIHVVHLSKYFIIGFIPPIDILHPYTRPSTTLFYPYKCIPSIHIFSSIHIIIPPPMRSLLCMDIFHPNIPSIHTFFTWIYPIHYSIHSYI